MAKDSNTDTLQPAHTTALTADTLDEKALYLGDSVSSSPDADAKAIVARILSGTTAEEVFGGPGTLLSAEDVIGKPFTLHEVEARESDIEGAGPGVYALLHVSPWGTTNQVLISCGARNVMAAAFRGKQLGLLPRGPVTIVEGKKTRAGFTPLWLKDMPQDEADGMARVIGAFTSEESGEPF